MTRRINVAIVGIPGTTAEAVVTALEERDFPVGEVFLLSEDASAGGALRHFGKTLKIQPVSSFDFSQAEIAFFCGDAALSHANAPAAAESGCVVIDCSPAYRDDPEVPLVIPEVNPQALDGFRQRNMVALPSPSTLLLLMVLKPLHDAAGVVRADVTSYESVSVQGKAGVDELSGQIVALMNMREAEIATFSERIAFNIIPQVGALLENGYTEGEMEMVTETQKILGDTGITLNPTAVQVPVFYGNSLSVHLQTVSTLTADEARLILGEQAGITLESSPTPAIQGASQDQVYVGRVRDAVAEGGGINLWITSDNTRKGAALSAVQIAELLEKCYM